MSNSSSQCISYSQRGSSLTNQRIFIEENDMEHNDENRKACLYSPCCKGFVVGALLACVALAALLTLQFKSASTMATELSTIIVTTTAAATTTTTTPQFCSNPQWNQTGEFIQGISDRPYTSPLGMSIDSSDTIYVCDHTTRNVEAWSTGAINGTIVADTYHANYLIFDKNGYFYVNEHIDHTVRRYSTNSIIGTVVAGVTGVSSSALNNFKYPLGIDIDDNLNLYVADRDNKRVMKWAPNASTGTMLINITASNMSTISVSALRLVKNSPNQVYLGDISYGRVYLWSFGSANPDLILNQVRNSTALSSPQSLILDLDGNLYVGESSGKGRIIRYCPNSTIGEIIVDDSNGNSTMRKVSIAFDSQQNLYALLSNGKVIKYALI